jgi:hypothetical protein
VESLHEGFHAAHSLHAVAAYKACDDTCADNGSAGAFEASHACAERGCEAHGQFRVEASRVGERCGDGLCAIEFSALFACYRFGRTFFVFFLVHVCFKSDFLPYDEIAIIEETIEKRIWKNGVQRFWETGRTPLL